jgi:hypothetical protein
MEAAVVPPPEYAYLVGCAALGGLSTQRSPRCYTQPGAGCRGFYAPSFTGRVLPWDRGHGA